MIAASHRVLPMHLNQDLDIGDSDDLQLHDMTAVVCSLHGAALFIGQCLHDGGCWPLL